MALEDMTIAQLRDLGNKTHVTLAAGLNKADIIEALEKAGVTVDEPAEEPEVEEEPEESQSEVEGEPVAEEPEQAPISEVEEDVKPNSEPEEPAVKAGGYVATEKGWELTENPEG